MQFLTFTIAIALGLLFSLGCSDNNSGSSKIGCDGTTCDTGSETLDDTHTHDSSSQSEDVETDSQTQDTGSQTQDTDSQTQDTDSSSASGTGTQETQIEDETDTGDEPIAPHGTIRGFLFTAKPTPSLAEKARLYFASYDGETITPVSGEVTLDIYTPCWAQDGDDIYFVQGFDVRTVAWPVPMPFSPLPLSVTGWSNEVSCRGNMLAYTSQPTDGYSVHVYTRSMNVDNENQITNYEGSLVENKPMMPSLSPSLDAVAYGLLNGDDVFDTLSSDVYVAHLGTPITRENLTKEGAVVQAKVVNRAPEWSPDGSLIAYLHVLDGKSEIRIIDPTAPDTSKSTVTEIENGFGGADVLAWSPDSQVIAVIDGDDFGTIRIVTLEGAEEGTINTNLYEIDSISWR